jgi:3',5'-cyclic AMP phosphodiesterase CpdA
MNPLKFYLVTDTHYFEESLGAEGKAFEKYMSREQYFMKESGKIIDSVFNKIAEDKETDIVIIPGDLTKNGEKESHKSFLKQLYKLKESGKKIYVITAGHDYNEYSFAFKNDERIDVEGTDFNDLYDMYYDFGYSEALAFDKRTHSYIAEVSDGVRMLGINCDSYQNPKGTMDDELISWAKVQLDKAKEDGCSVFAICHYPIIPSLPVFDLVGDAKIKEWRKVASFLSDNGVELIMTGHMHIQSINEFYSENGNRLIDVCTSCLVGSPAKYRKITVDEKSVMKVESISVDCFDQEFFDKQFGQAIVNRVSNELSGGKGIVKHLKKFGNKIYKKATLGALSRVLWIRIDKSLRKKKLTELVAEIGLAIFIGDQPYVVGTPEHKMFSKVFKRFSFIIKKFEPKLEKDGIKVNLTEMIMKTIGNNKGYSDNNAEFKLK